ncbi:hypothetical protein BH10PSE10_BH10PSE10_13830 [soil metagenome]
MRIQHLKGLSQHPKIPIQRLNILNQPVKILIQPLKTVNQELKRSIQASSRSAQDSLYKSIELQSRLNLIWNARHTSSGNRGELRPLMPPLTAGRRNAGEFPPCAVSGKPPGGRFSQGTAQVFGFEWLRICTANRGSAGHARKSQVPCLPARQGGCYSLAPEPVAVLSPFPPPILRPDPQWQKSR